jgi:uncharacterized repeat protein (TIGR03843 family)
MADNKKKRKRAFRLDVPVKLGDLQVDTFQVETEATSTDEVDLAEPEMLQPPPPPVLSVEEIEASKAWRLELDEATLLDILKRGTFGVYKLIPWGSNYTFLASLHDEEDSGKEYAVVYKPLKGEAPLWDFPSGTLYRRERAAYLVSRALGWNFIPPVIIRDGPHGVGTVQLFIDVDEQVEFYTFRRDHAHELKRIAVYDAITNNADRKAGHCLLGLDNFIWGIDHGLCFNTVPKMRTIIWDYSGEPLPTDIYEDLAGLLNNAKRANLLRGQLRELLDRREVDIFFRRLEQTVENPIFPPFSSRRQIPWGFF